MANKLNNQILNVKFMTKKQVVYLLMLLHEWQCSYSGKDKTMYVHGKGVNQHQLEFLALPTKFKLIAQ